MNEEEIQGLSKWLENERLKISAISNHSKCHALGHAEASLETLNCFLNADPLVRHVFIKIKK